MTSQKIEPRPDLLHAKLRSLARTVGAPDLQPVGGRLPAGTVAADDGRGGAWLLVEAEVLRALGAVLLWLHREDRWDEANLVVGDGTLAPLVAVRLAAFEAPPAVWAVEGASLQPVPVPDAPDELPGIGGPARFDRAEILASVDDATRVLASDLLDRAQRSLPGVTLEAEPGAVVLAVAGLEVARLVVRDGEAVFEVGVGAIDQDARRQVVGARSLSEDSLGADLADLEGAVAVVARHRRPGGPPHPLRRLQRSRWLRSEVLADPTLAGLPADLLLEPVADPVRRASLHEDAPAGAIAPGEVVVCSAGIDLGAVPTAAHHWVRACAGGEPARLTLVVAQRDVHPATEQLVARLRSQARARLAAVPAPWEAAPPASL